ncbi:MAG: TIGR02147 family protein [Proteobacteria bacterium]|nr:TIGR02147 family protein [Pseudomonadota bacterium]
MLSIYEFTDYRRFLHDWFWAAKASNPKMSFRFMAMKLGLKAPNHFHLVISSQRHLSSPLIDKFMRFAKLSPKERHYFKLLFKASIAKGGSADQKKWNDEIQILQKSIKKNSSESLTEIEDQTRFVGHRLAWYLKMGAGFFEGLSVSKIGELVQKHCRFTVESKDVSEAIQILIAAKQAKIVDGGVTFEGASVLTKWDFDHASIKEHHKSNLSLALETISWPIDQRFLTSVTIPCDDELKQSIIADVRALCLSILDKSQRLDLAIQQEDERSLKGSPSGDPKKPNDRALQQLESQGNRHEIVTLQLSLFPFFSFYK